MMQSYDIVVVGGGMVGLTLACALADTDLRIAIIEGHQPDPDLPQVPDNRVSALSRASENILRNVQAWPGVETRRQCRYQAMSVWEKDSFAKIEFDATSLNQTDLGTIVENRVIQLALWERAKQLDNVSFFVPQTCQSMVTGESEVWLTLSNGQHITAKLLVGADGARSWVRQQASIPLTQRDYGHHAIVATVNTELSHQGVARQIFTDDGPLAFLPLPDEKQSSIVWSCSPERAQALMESDEASFCKQLSTAFDVQLGLCSLAGERSVYPLTMRFARDFIAQRVALIGDAAHTIHPLAGQGVNLGILDAVSLAQELKQLWSDGKDIGVQRHLRSYERWRKAEATKMIAAMQGFRDLFEGQHPLKKLVRGVGMRLVNDMPFAKESLIRRALGIEGDMPELAVLKHTHNEAS